MKTRNLFLTLFLSFVTITAFAQSTIGIPVQGIARDADGTARIGQSVINLSFELYTLDNTTEIPLGSPQTQTLSTDSFGVFSTIIDTNGLRPAFANSPVYLRISEDGTTISDEQLNSVPYAIAADNGVPTGAIMPFVGTSAQVPVGWLLCDGAAIPSGIQYNALITLQGNNTPNLQGMFLRGAGTNNFTSVTTTLKGVQDDSNLQHSHTATVTVNNGGNHRHKLTYGNGGGEAGVLAISGDGAGIITDISGSGFNNGGNTPRPHSMPLGGTHGHSASASIADSGSTESRPVNYGVNYIIKL